MLYEEGAFQLDDPIARYLPEFLNTPVWAGGNAPLEDTSPQETPITVRQIMTHTSGLTYGFMQTNVVDAAYRKAGIGGPSHITNLQAWVKKRLKSPWYLSQAHNGTIVFRRMC
jgi:CubicO group peptidase (beta-lactamase class C family)